MDRSRRPPDVEEALSSMLWTPYQRTPSISSSSSASSLSDIMHVNNVGISPTRLKFRRPSVKHKTTNPLGSNNIRPTIRKGNPNNYTYYYNHADYHQYQQQQHHHQQQQQPTSLNDYNFGLNNQNNVEKGIFFNPDNNNLQYILPTYISLPSSSSSSSPPLSGSTENGMVKMNETIGVGVKSQIQTSPTTAMVHSFTDNFLQYQVMSICFYYYYVLFIAGTFSCNRCYINIQRMRREILVKTISCMNCCMMLRR